VAASAAAGASVALRNSSSIACSCSSVTLSITSSLRAASLRALTCAVWAPYKLDQLVYLVDSSMISYA